MKSYRDELAKNPKTAPAAENEVVAYLKKEKAKARSNTQGCGCLLLILGVVGALLIGLPGWLLAALGFVVLVYGLIR